MFLQSVTFFTLLIECHFFYITISDNCVQYSLMYMFIGEVIQKQQVLLTSSERMVKKSSLYTVCEFNARKIEYLDRFRIQYERSKVLHGNT